MPDDITEPYADDTTTYDGMDTTGGSELGYEVPDDTTTYDGMDVDGTDDSELEGYEQPSDTTTY